MINFLFNIHNISSRNTYWDSKAKILEQQHKSYHFVPATWNIKQCYTWMYDKLIINADILKCKGNIVGIPCVY